MKAMEKVSITISSESDSHLETTNRVLAIAGKKLTNRSEACRIGLKLLSQMPESRMLEVIAKVRKEELEERN